MLLSAMKITARKDVKGQYTAYGETPTFNRPNNKIQNEGTESNIKLFQDKTTWLSEHRGDREFPPPQKKPSIFAVSLSRMANKGFLWCFQ